MIGLYLPAGMDKTILIMATQWDYPLGNTQLLKYDLGSCYPRDVLKNGNFS